jgi:hypothetical protein
LSADQFRLTLKSVCGNNAALVATFFTSPRITGSKKQSDEGAALFAVRVHATVSLFFFE